MLSRLSLRNLLLFATLLVLIFQFFPIGEYIAEDDYLNVDRPFSQIDIVEKDVFVVFLSPKIENLSARCQPLRRGGLFDLSISTRYVDIYLGEVSVVGVKLNEPGTYNLTISFASNKSWGYTLGVYTRNLEFYEKHWGEGIAIRGAFVEYSSFKRHPGNWTIVITLKSHSLTSSFSYFSHIKIPAPMSMALLLACWALIAYINSFILVDTYFKSKKEIITNIRWIVVGLIMLLSIYAAYQTYNFIIFVIPGEG